MGDFSQALHYHLFSTISAVVSWTVLASMAWIIVLVMVWKNFPLGITIPFVWMVLGFSVLAFDGWYARIKGKAPIHAFVRKCLGVE